MTLSDSALPSLPGDQTTVRNGRHGRYSARAPGDLLRVSRWELRRLVNRVCRDNRSNVPIDPTALVHEVARRMLGAGGPQDLPSRSDFYADLAHALRRMLRQQAQAGFGPASALTMVELPCSAGPSALDGLLSRLEEKSPRHAQIAILRLFGGMTTAEIADQMGLSQERVRVGWQTTKEWLSRWLVLDRQQ